MRLGFRVALVALGIVVLAAAAIFAIRDRAHDAATVLAAAPDEGVPPPPPWTMAELRDLLAAIDTADAQGLRAVRPPPPFIFVLWILF